MLTSNDSEWIFDFRKAFLNPKFLHIFARFFWQEMGHLYPFQIWWLEMWVIPLLSAIILEWMHIWKPTNAFIVRKERKETGLGNKIEWVVWSERIILIDDLYNSGNAFLKICHSLEVLWKKPTNFFAFVHFWNETGIQRLIDKWVFIHYIFTLGDFGLRRWKIDNIFSVINPKSKFLYALKNPNRFLIVPKSNPLSYNKLLICWGEWWSMVWIEKDTWYIMWEFKTGYHERHKSILSSPISVGNLVIFWAYDGNLYALDAETGKEKWKNAFADFIGSSPCFSHKNNLLYIGTEHSSLNHKWGLLAVHKKTWENSWFVPFHSFVHCSPGYSEKNNLVVCGSNDNRIVICNWTTGEIQAELKVQWEIKWGFWFSKDESIAYFWSWDGNMYALDILTGEIQWQYKTDNIIYTTPLVVDNWIVFWSYDSYFYHLDFHGNLIQKIKTRGKIASSAVKINEEIIAFWSNDGNIYFYDIIRRSIITTILHDERITTKILYVNPDIYLCDHMNQIFQIQNINSYLWIS